MLTAFHDMEGMKNGWDQYTECIFDSSSTTRETYDNGIIHHDPDGQYHGKKGKHVDGVPEQLKEEKGPHNGHGHGNGRNQC